MKPIPTNHLFSACAAVAALLPLSASAAVFIIPDAISSGFVGEFNPANRIQSTAPASNITVSNFTTDVLTAFTGGNGGVINFNRTNSGELSMASGDSFARTLALNKDFSVTITDTSSFKIAGFSSAGSTSTGSGGSHMFASNGTNTTATFTFATTGSGYAVGEQIQQVGFAVLNRNNANNPYTVVFTLDNATTVTLTDDVNPVGAANNSDNTFFGYQASGDRFITSFTINSGNAAQPWLIDDLGFVTAVIPEPSAALLGAVGMLALLTNRRRNG